MPVSQRLVIFICTVLLCSQQLTTGLTCYDCTSCSTVNSNTNTVAVADNAGYSCYKITGSALSVSVANRGAMVGCTSANSDVGGVTGSIQCCSTNLCNSGIALSTSFSLAIVTAALGVLFRSTIID